MAYINSYDITEKRPSALGQMTVHGHAANRPAILPLSTYFISETPTKFLKRQYGVSPHSLPSGYMFTWHLHSKRDHTAYLEPTISSPSEIDGSRLLQSAISTSPALVPTAIVKLDADQTLMLMESGNLNNCLWLCLVLWITETQPLCSIQRRENG